MAVKTRYAFGIEVLQEATQGTYIDPTKPLCIQSDSERDSAAYKTKECNIISTTMGGAYDIVLDGNNPKSTIPVKQPLPLVLGGIEDILLAARLKKATQTAPDRDEYTFDSTHQNSVSSKVTTLRTTSTFRGGIVDFKITGDVNDYVVFDGTITTTRDSLTELAETDPDNALPSTIIDGATGVFFFSCNAPILINGTGASCKSFEFALNATLADSENDMDCKTSDIVDFKPTLTLTADSKNDLRFKTSDMVAGTQFNIKIPFADNLGVEKGYILMPKCVLSEDPKITNNNGLEEVSATYSLRKTAGDDNFTIAFLA